MRTEIKARGRGGEPARGHKVRMMEGERRGEGKGMQANKGSGCRLQWWTEASRPGPQALEAEFLPQLQASGSSCHLPAMRRVSVHLRIMWNEKSTVLQALSSKSPDAHMLCDLEQSNCLSGLCP